MSSLVIPSPESLSGRWTVADAGNSCEIYLKAQRLEQANGYRLDVSSNCTPHVLPQQPEAWRPRPDGIALLDKDGLTILFFAQEGDHYRSQIWEKTGKILKREDG